MNPEAQRLIEDAMTAKNMNRVNLAVYLGRSPQYVTDMFKGKKRLDVRLAVQLEAVLDVSAEALMACLIREARDNETVRATRERLNVTVAEQAAKQQRRATISRLSKWRRNGPLAVLSDEQLAAIDAVLTAPQEPSHDD